MANNVVFLSFKETPGIADFYLIGPEGEKFVPFGQTMRLHLEWEWVEKRTYHVGTRDSLGPVTSITHTITMELELFVKFLREVVEVSEAEVQEYLDHAGVEIDLKGISGSTLADAEGRIKNALRESGLFTDIQIASAVVDRRYLGDHRWWVIRMDGDDRWLRPMTTVNGSVEVILGRWVNHMPQHTPYSLDGVRL